MAFQIPLYSGRQIVRHGFAFHHLSKSLSAQMLSAGRSASLASRALTFPDRGKRSCFYVYGHRLSGLNRFLSYRCDFPFPSADGFCRFGNDMFSFSGILLSVLGKYGSVPDGGPVKDCRVFVRFFGPMPFTPRNSSSVAGRVSAILRRTVSERICDVDRFSFLPKSGGAVRVSHICFFFFFVFSPYFFRSAEFSKCRKETFSILL